MSKLINQMRMNRTGHVRALPVTLDGLTEFSHEILPPRYQDDPQLIGHTYEATFRMNGYCKANEVDKLEAEFERRLRRHIYGEIHELILDLVHAEYGRDMERVTEIRKEMEALVGLS